MHLARFAKRQVEPHARHLAVDRKGQSGAQFAVLQKPVANTRKTLLQRVDRLARRYCGQGDAFLPLRQGAKRSGNPDDSHGITSSFRLILQQTKTPLTAIDHSP